MNILFLATGANINIKQQDIYTDLVKNIVSKGHSVSFVYPFEKRSKRNTELYFECGVQCLGVKTGNITKCNFIEKGISLILLEKIFIKNIKKYLCNETFDLILYTTPPITFEKVIKFIKKRDNAKSYLMLKDIFPDNAVDLELFSSKSLLYKYFRKKEMKLYKQADHIGCMSPKNVEYLLNHNPFIAAHKVHVNPNTLTPNEISISDDEKREIRRKYDVPNDKVVFLYGGNLGKPQGVDFLLECIIHNEKRENTFFAISGSGTEYNKIQECIKNNNIKNTILLPYIPREEYARFCSSCDVGLIFLDKRFTIPNFPQRLLSYMQSKIPVLAAIDKNTDFGPIIEKGGFGLWSEAGNLEHFNQNVDSLLKSDRSSMGVLGFDYLMNHYTSEISYDILIKAINSNSN